MSEESRQVAEAVGPDRDARAREVRARAERRAWSVDAIRAADKFMTELDRRRAAELEEARS